jgi:hypothetical protein
MSQSDVLDWLMKQYEIDAETFHTSKSIENGLRKEGKSFLTTARSVSKLFWMGFLEIEQDGFNRRAYRLKKKYSKIRVVNV